ncbi:MAG TPA: MFS transporter, partial [Microlunatus sp.]|nr:MFS transporter [Microlunatus sp.]
VSARTYPLGVGTVAVGTSGYSLTGLLPVISRELGASASTTGQLVTVFALTCALAGPLLTVLTRRWERRRLLVVALLVTGLGNALAAVAPNLEVLAGARIVTALGTSVYTAAAAATAAQINTPQRRARAVAVVFAGLTVALLGGIPAIRLLSTPLGYPGVFWSVAALCGLGAVGVAAIVPAVAAPPAASLRERLTAAGDRQVLAVLVTTLLIFMSTFAVYTYAATLLEHTTGGRAGLAGALLAGYGAGAAVGNVLGGRAADRFGPRPCLLAATAICAVLLFVLPVATRTVGSAAVVLTVWGCASWSINAPITAWLVHLAPTQANLLLSLVGSAIYLGMGLGGLVGGAVIAWVGVGMLGPVAGNLSAAAHAILLSHAARPPTGTAPPTPAIPPR